MPFSKVEKVQKVNKLTMILHELFLSCFRVYELTSNNLKQKQFDHYLL